MRVAPSSVRGSPLVATRPAWNRGADGAATTRKARGGKNYAEAIATVIRFLIAQP
jgi:hypothetical protein